MKFKSEKKPGGGVVEGVAYANGKGSYIPFVSKQTKDSARSKAAKSMMKKGRC